MEKETTRLAEKLLHSLYSAQVLKQVSDNLEELSQNKPFKQHANAIVTDGSLTQNQKKTQLSYLVRSVESPEVYRFLSDRIEAQDWWLFQSDKIDYFDRFVQSFQKLTQSVEIIYLTTAIPLKDAFLAEISKDLSRSFNKHVILRHLVKSGLIGGVQVKLENMVFDYSLAYKFRQFERQWTKTLRQTESAIGRHLPD